MTEYGQFAPLLYVILPQLPLVFVYAHGISLCAQRSETHGRVSSLVLPAILVHLLLVTVLGLAAPILIKSRGAMELYLKYAVYGMPVVVGVCCVSGLSPAVRRTLRRRRLGRSVFAAPASSGRSLRDSPLASRSPRLRGRLSPF